MPELPEVEATRRHLEPVLSGAAVAAAEVRRERMVRRHARPEDFTDRVTGRRVLTVGRHGKFLMTRLDGDITWVTHLGMSGRMQVAEAGDEEAAHTNIVVHLDSGAEVRMVDPRTFGFVAAFLPDELRSGPMGRLGPDALTDLPSSALLAERMAGRSVAIKALLLDQCFIAGLGNIYADEVLFRAGIDPERPSGSLLSTDVERLHAAIGPVLRDGLAHGGTSLGDLAYLLPDGRAGTYLDRLAVYGKEGEPCPQCGSPIRRVVVRGRGTHSCPRCQR